MQRKVFSAEFKAKVAMEALTGRKTINEIAGIHEVHPNQVTSWKREAQEGLKATRLPTTYPSPAYTARPASNAMANALTFCMPSQMALGPG